MTTTSSVRKKPTIFYLVPGVAAALWFLGFVPPTALKAQDTAAWITAATSSDSIVFIDVKSLSWRGTTLTGWQLSHYRRGTPSMPTAGRSIERVYWTCGESGTTRSGEIVVYDRSGAVLDRFPEEANWSENIPGTIGESAAATACSFAPRDFKSRRQVDRSTSDELRRQMPAEKLFDYRSTLLRYEAEGATTIDAIYYYNRAFYYAEAFDCGKNSQGSGQQAIREDPENSSSPIIWQDFDYSSCNSIKEAVIKQRVALEAYFLEERKPISTIDEVIATARKKMPWPTVGKPKSPKAKAATKVRKKR